MHSNREPFSKDSVVKALSIRQPWAWLIVQGHKTIENRCWRTHYRGRLLIHAAVDPAPFYEELAERVRRDFGIVVPKRCELELGGLVGECEMIDCIDRSDSPWFCGPFGFCLTNAKQIPFRKLRGRLSLFNVHQSEIE